MTRINITQRLALLGACGALAAGGALLPSTASAAPATPQTPAVQTVQEHVAHEGRAKTIVTTKITVTKRTLSDGRVKVTTVKTVTKITKNHHGKVVKKSVTTTTTVKFRPAPDHD
ncbi:hypothetical protein ACIO7M_30845 [Streptomyces toxytricini]|uniref:Secreted protein n=1 Tax=Streptomyces toxytricini TaxID=67369 RepID=A0ABW8EQE1_STRT5